MSVKGMELTGQKRPALCKEKSKGRATFPRSSRRMLALSPPDARF
jgi:hypothetical protein